MSDILQRVENMLGDCAIGPMRTLKTDDLTRVLYDAHEEIERLRAEVEEQARLNGNCVERELAAEAEIKRLRAREARLREVLREIEWSNNSEWQSDRARAALGEEKK